MKEAEMPNINQNQEDLQRRKIFVGGLAHGTNEYEFKTYFENFGTIIDSVIINDTKTERPRGFGFVTFDSEESVTNVLKNRFHELKNKLVEVKIARPKEPNSVAVKGNHNGSLQQVSGRYLSFPQAQYTYNPMQNGPFNSTGLYCCANLLPYYQRYGGCIINTWNGGYAHGYDTSHYSPSYGSRYGFSYDPNYPGGFFYWSFY